MPRTVGGGRSEPPSPTSPPHRCPTSCSGPSPSANPASVPVGTSPTSADEGWLYLADVLDLGSRRIVGYSMDERMPTELVAGAMRMAVDVRGGNTEGMVFHHDRGAQYLSREFRALCATHQISQ